MIDLTANTSAFGLCSDEWQAVMLDYVAAGGPYQRYWQGKWEEVSLGSRHNLHKDRAYRAKPAPVVETKTDTAYLNFGSLRTVAVNHAPFGAINVLGSITTTFHDGNPVKAEWIAK